MIECEPDAQRRWLPEPGALRAYYLGLPQDRETVAIKAQGCVEACIAQLPSLTEELSRSHDFEAARDSFAVLLLMSGVRNAWLAVFEFLHAGMEFCTKLDALSDGADLAKCQSLARDAIVWGRQTRLPAG